MVLPCGLLTCLEEPVPLKSISVNLSICEFVAGVSATLNYENEEDIPVEAFFVFPMDEDSAVYRFEAFVDGKKIVAELQDKMKARAKYEKAISEGHQAFLLEEDISSRDVFCCNVGNLSPGSKVALTLHYVQELPLQADGALRYVLPAILNPRYNLFGRSNSYFHMKIPVVPLEDLPYTLSMVATISSQHGIEKVRSNCALSPLEYLGDKKTDAQVSLANGHKFDRDVELLIYYLNVHKPSVAIEMGKPQTRPESLMREPTAMVSFYPNIPEAQPPITCGEFIFLMDRSGSMQCPMNKRDCGRSRMDVAKETLVLLLKSLPIGCYFNVFGFGSTYEKFFQDSVRYTQHTMEEALRKLKLMQANLGGTEILSPLQTIFNGPAIAGHPLQLFIFTDGEVTDTFTVIREVRSNKQRHRCFSFGIGEGASTSLIKGIARVAGGTAEFIFSRDRMQSKALLALKRALQPVVENVSLSWALPPGLSAKMLSPQQTAIFRGQRLIVYAHLIGRMLPEEATGEVCLRYTLQGKSYENKVTFYLHPKHDANFTIHRLAAKSLLQVKDMGFRETPANDKKEVLKISTECGVISSHTAFVAINKTLNQPVQGPLARRDIPKPILLGSISVMPKYYGGGQPVRLSSFYPNVCEKNDDEEINNRCRLMSNRDLYTLGLGKPHALGVKQRKKCMPRKETYPDMGRTHSTMDETNLETHHTVFGDNHLVQLISLQKADGSWELNEGLALVLGLSVEELLAALPYKNYDSSSWATILAVLWLNTNGQDLKCEWELLEMKAVNWIRIHAGTLLRELVRAAIGLLKTTVDASILRI